MLQWCHSQVRPPEALAERLRSAGEETSTRIQTMPNTSGLIQACLDRHHAGDPNARDELIRHSQERLRALVRQMLGRFPTVRRWEETSDVVQNVLIRLDRALRDLPLTTVQDFFVVAACNVRRELINLARAYRRTEEEPAVHKEPVDDSDDPVTLARWGEIHAFIAALPEEMRQPFDLIYYQGLTREEAATLLGISERTLRRRWQDARLRLMAWLGEDFSL